MPRPNVLFLMCDQLRADAITSLGNDVVYTPSIDRLVARGVSFTNAYSTCPVCMPARYTIRTGREPTTTGLYGNSAWRTMHADIERATGPYLAATMAKAGYRTWGVGKFHTVPWDAAVGFEVQLRSEEMYATPEQRSADAYASWVAREHPAYSHVEQLMGERSEMYYIPQMSPLPAEVNQEAWATDRAVEQISIDDPRPWFGFVSFIGPHPPLAPPVPYNRIYDPDRMPDPIRGDIAVDHMDELLPWMNYAIFAEDISDPMARIVKARYYAEVTYIDACLGRVLDAIDDDTLVCFFSDHGDHLGDHHAWQKDGFFEASARVPFLVSWPERMAGGQRTDDLVCLTDLFGIATTAAGEPEIRDGCDVIGGAHREVLYGYHGRPGRVQFKVMVRFGDWKYIWLANGGREQLFDLAEDPHELRQRIEDAPAAIADRVRALALETVRERCPDALDGDALKTFEFQARPRRRIYQHDWSRGITGFPEHPRDVLG